MTDKQNDVMNMTTAEEAALHQQLNENYGEARDELNTLVGHIQMANSFAKLGDTITLQKLHDIRERKLYKAYRGKTFILPTGETAAAADTWEGFCQLIGSSKGVINERLANLKQFGQEAAETFERIGVSTKTLRLARKLPEDEQALVAEYINKDDVSKDDVQKLIDDLDDKHQRELNKKDAALNAKDKEVESLTARVNANRNMYSKTQQEVESLKVQLEEKRLKPNDYSQLTKDIEAIAAKSATQIIQAGQNMADLAEQLLNKINENNSRELDKALAMAVPNAYTLFFESLQQSAALFDFFDHLMGGYAEQPKVSYDLIKQLAANNLTNDSAAE